MKDGNNLKYIDEIKTCKPEDPTPTYSPYLNRDIKTLLKCWDEKHGTELIKIEELLGYLSGRFALYWGWLNSGIKIGCSVNKSGVVRKIVNEGINTYNKINKTHHLNTLSPVDEGSFVSEFCDVFFPTK